MAEQTQEKRTFKWGDREYLLDDLLAEHAKREQEYYNFARQKGQYDDAALQGLRSAISNRIAAVKSGQAFDGDGALAGDRVDNTSIQTQKKGLFKKEKYVDQDNTEWAKYYLNKLVGQLNPYTREPKKESEGWDLTKHGLGAYLTGQGLNAKDIFEKYDLRDKDNPENPRSFDQRRALLKQHLSGYKDWLAKKGFDFTKNDNEWDDNFGADFDKFVLDYDSLDINSLTSALRKFGAGDGYTTAFTSDRWDLSKTNEEMDAEAKALAEKKKKENADKAWNEEKSRRYNIYSGLDDLRSSQIQKYAGVDRIFDLSDEDLDAHLASVGVKDEQGAKTYWNNLDQQYAQNPYDVSVASVILPLRARQGLLRSIDSGDYSGWMYDPSTINESRQSVMAIDTVTGKMEEIFIGNLKNDWNRIKTKFMRDNNYSDPLAAYDKDGGVIQFQTGGALSSYDYIQNYKKEKNEARAVETGNDPEIQKARDRVVSNGKNRLQSDERTLANPDAGFTGAEVARLATIAADITSMFLDPVTGTAVGLGSTLTNFGADVADDGFQWADVKNLAINTGFDLLGAIPLFGDALGTGTKITRQLLKWAPRAMAGLAAYQGVKNFDGMMDSWGKLTSGDKDQKLTVQDWRNIAQSISLLTGGVRATRNKVAQSRMKQQARLDDVVGVNVVDKNGKIQQVLVDGKIAEQVKAAKGSKAEVEKVLSQLDEFKDKFGENGTLSVNVKNNGEFQFNPLTRHTNPDSSKGGIEWRGFRKEGLADVNEVFDFSKAQGYNASRGFQIPGVSKYLNTQHQRLLNHINNGQQMVNRPNPNTLDLRGKMSDAEIDLQMKQILKDQGVDAQAEVLRQASDQRLKDIEANEGQLTQAKTDLDAAKNKIQGYGDEASLQTQKTNLEQSIAGMPDAQVMHNAHQQAASQQASIASLQQKRKRLNAEQSGHLEALRQKKTDANAVITETTKKLNQAQKDLTRHSSRLKSLERAFAKKYPQKPKRGDANYQQYRKDAAAIKRLRDSVNVLQTTIKGYNTTISDNQAIISKADVDITKVRGVYSKKFNTNKAAINTAKGKLSTAQPIADQYNAYTKAKGDLATVNQQLNDYAQVPIAQQKVSDLEGIINQQQTAHTQAYQDLEALLANLRTSHASIGGRNMTWDINDIISRYNIQNAFKQGGSIDRNKINKFLNYAKR